MTEFFGSALTTVQVLSAVLVFLLGLALLAVIFMYLVDVNQKTHVIRRNFSVIGRFRYLVEKLDKYFSQYFFAQDREKMPFNKAQRTCLSILEKTYTKKSTYWRTHAA